MYLLDTNVVSELRKPRPHGSVVAWLRATEDAQLHLSAVTLGEIQAARHTRLAHAAAGLLSNAGWLSSGSGLSSITPVLHFGLETAHAYI